MNFTHNRRTNESAFISQEEESGEQRKDHRRSAMEGCEKNVRYADCLIKCYG